MSVSKDSFRGGVRHETRRRAWTGTARNQATEIVQCAVSVLLAARSVGHCRLCCRYAVHLTAIAMDPLDVRLGPRSGDCIVQYERMLERLREHEIADQRAEPNQ